MSKCPILMVSSDRVPGKGHECLEDNCSWFIRGSQKCALYVLASSVDETADKYVNGGAQQ